ncbi:PHP domain-containing protein [bacterium]|nr:PHP domain-containing protein [bacterium]
MIIRADLHIHSGDDPYDKLPYTVFDAIDQAASRGINCIAITDHSRFSWTPEYAAHAKKMQVLLIPGIEAQIKNKDVIILNSDKDIEKIKSFDELRAYRTDRHLIIAPHSFYPIKYALKKLLYEHAELFDVIEISSCYLSWFNKFNLKARKAAMELSKPLICNSDSHALWQIGNVWTEIQVDNFTIQDVISAIKNGKTKPSCRPMTSTEFFKFFVCGDFTRRFKKMIESGRNKI